MPPDEHESAVQAWLDSPSTQREIAIIWRRFPLWTDFQVYSFAVSLETLVALEVYELPDLPPPDDDPDAWKRAA